MNKVFGLLTICKRAGKLIMGMDSVKEAVADKSAYCVLVASDISMKSLKEVKYFLKGNGIKLLEIDETRKSIWDFLGRESVVLGICDEGFSKKLQTMCNEIIIQE